MSDEVRGGRGKGGKEGGKGGGSAGKGGVDNSQKHGHSAGK